MGIREWRSRQGVRRTWDATCTSPQRIAAYDEIRGNNGQRGLKIASSLSHFGLQMFFTAMEHGAEASGNGNSLSISTTGYEA